MIELITAKCPNCGANIKVNGNLENYICQYCGSNIFIKEIIPKFDSCGKIENIKNYIILKEYQNGINLLNEVLEKEPFNYKAQALKIKCCILNFDEINFNPKSSTYTDKNHWTQIEEIVNSYKRMKSVDKEMIGEKELADIKDILNKYIKWNDDRIADEEKCTIINQKMKDCIKGYTDYSELKIEKPLMDLNRLIGLSLVGKKSNHSGASQKSVISELKEVHFNRDSNFEMTFIDDKNNEWNWCAKCNKYDNLDDLIKDLDNYLEGQSKQILILKEQVIKLQELVNQINEIMDEMFRKYNGFFKSFKVDKGIEEYLKLKANDGRKIFAFFKINKITLDGKFIFEDAGKQRTAVFLNVSNVEEIISRCEAFIEFLK